MSIKSLLSVGLLIVTGCFLSCNTGRKTENLSFWHNKERNLRYIPDGEYFVNKNGDRRFTRAIYGTNTGFRFETSDYPELGLYMPRLGGSMYMAVELPDTVVWIKDFVDIESRFRSGERTYTIRDKKILGKGEISISMLALSNADGVICRFNGKNLSQDIRLITIYGGASNKRFSREGDLGADPKDCFYIKPENCSGNIFELRENSFINYYGKGAEVMNDFQAYENKDIWKNSDKKISRSSEIHKLKGEYSVNTVMDIVDANKIDNLEALLKSEGTECPLITVSFDLGESPVYMKLLNPDTENGNNSFEVDYSNAVNFRTRVADRMKIETPDPYINTLGGIFAGAEDAVWEAPGYLHGAIGWRMPLTGWRASYLADLIGEHGRARTHFDGYAASQVTDVPVTLPHLQDNELNMARSLKKWGTPMYSNGYICRSPNTTNVMHHYDMNLVYIDQLLWHLNWTGDMEYVKKVFPIIKRHLEWEKRTFDPDNDFLYDAYCCIWASDALQYNGGAVTHSSAYNYRANKMAAEIAEKIGENPEPYKKESVGILNAINKNLWIEDKGWWAEFKDNMGYKRLHENAALWTVYHSIDSDIHDPFKAYQATRYVDNYLPHIPVVANGFDETDNYVVSTTNWQPYMWSINNVAFAEIVHTSYSFWQAGRCDEAFKMFKGAIMDAMYLGSGPGNITQISHYDAARGETYRDFADPVAVGVRAVIQGMYGILPDLMNKRIVIRPGFPSSWDHASLSTLNMEYDFRRSGMKDSYRITPKLTGKGNLIMELVVRATEIDKIVVNGKEVSYNIIEQSIGSPRISFDAGLYDSYDIQVIWSGNQYYDDFTAIDIAKGEDLVVEMENALEVFDPQNVLLDSKLNNDRLYGIVCGTEGHRTLFVKTQAGDFVYWKPLGINIQKPIDIINNSEAKKLSFSLKNNTSKEINGIMKINNSLVEENVILCPNEIKSFEFDTPVASMGSNRIVMDTSEGKHFVFNAINWNIENLPDTEYLEVDIDSIFNDEVNNIFAYGKYKSPRWKYTTLCVPTQGMGQWCHPNDLSVIDDEGLRQKSRDNTFTMPQGVIFRTPSQKGIDNIAFTTLWDNYPDSLSIPLNGKASKMYFLIAGSTYHMQSHILNGTLSVQYADGSENVLNLVLPENLLPLDQDIFIDNAAFYSTAPRPYRVRLKTGDVSKYHAGELNKRMSNNPIYIEGGMATMLDLPLDNNKELKKLTLETISNEVVIGLMAVTLMK